MTSHTAVLPRTSPTGRVPLWLLVEDALDSVSVSDGWADVERALRTPAVPVARRAPGGPVSRRCAAALALTLLLASAPALAVLDLLRLGD